MTNRKLAKSLREEVLRDINSNETPNYKKIDLENIEYISKNDLPYFSPIFTMTQDEILAFVETFDVDELATLSVQELNRIGEVLGVEPSILVQE